MHGFVDITADFRKASGVLQEGDVVKDEFFTLFEAVGALEIMDPKMDSGYLETGETLDDDFDPSSKLSAEQVLWIMDRLLGAEVSWHQGRPLSVSILTSLHVDALLYKEPKAIEHAKFSKLMGPSVADPLVDVVLRAYCLALIKCCGLVHETVVRQPLHEEEDFVSALFNKDLFFRFPVDGFVVSLDEALQTLTSHNGSLSNEIVQALTATLQLRKSFLLALDHCSVLRPQYDPTVWEVCSKNLERVTAHFVQTVPVPEAFSEKVHRRLASTFPPRPSMLADFETSISVLAQMFKNGAALFKVLDCTNMSSLVNFMHCFHLREPQCCIYLRCLLEQLISEDSKLLGDLESVEKFVTEDFIEMIQPAEPLSRALRSAGSKNVDRAVSDIMRGQYLFQSGQIYVTLLRALDRNRPRARRLLTHTVVEWENFQADVEDLDASLRDLIKEKPVEENIWALPLSSWVYYHKLEQMEWIVQLGFETEIYLPHEMASMYWYLGHVAEARVSHTERIMSFALQGQKTSQNKGKLNEQMEKTQDIFRFNRSHANATAIMATAMAALYRACFKLGVIPKPNLPYSTDELRHTLRMRPFIPIGLPTMPTHDEILGNIEGLIPASSTARSEKDIGEQLLRVATQRLATARAAWEIVLKHPAAQMFTRGCEQEWTALTKDIVKSAIAASLFAAQLQKALNEKKTNVRLELGRGPYHPWWTVPKLKA